MSKARELLERALDELVSQDMDLRSEFETSRGWESPKIIQEISEYLASEAPEKREPLSGEELSLKINYQPPIIKCPKHGEHPYTITSSIPGHQGAWCQICWLESLGEPLPASKLEE